MSKNGKDMDYCPGDTVVVLNPRSKEAQYFGEVNRPPKGKSIPVKVKKDSEGKPLKNSKIVKRRASNLKKIQEDQKYQEELHENNDLYKGKLVRIFDSKTGNSEGYGRLKNFKDGKWSGHLVNSVGYFIKEEGNFISFFKEPQDLLPVKERPTGGPYLQIEELPEKIRETQKQLQENHFWKLFLESRNN